MSFGGWIRHVAHKAKQAAKKAGQVIGVVVGQPVGTVVDGAENKDGGQDDDASTDTGHDA